MNKQMLTIQQSWIYIDEQKLGKSNKHWNIIRIALNKNSYKNSN